MALARSDKKPNLSVMFYSDDEGKTWSKPEEMQGSLAGERHKAVYDPISGRLLITFREIVYKDGKLDNNWMAGDWVAFIAQSSSISIRYSPSFCSNREITFRNGWVFSMIMVMSTSRAI